MAGCVCNRCAVLCCATGPAGMLVTHDGQLVVKQWPLILRDLSFFFHAKPAILYTLLATAATISIFRLANAPADQKTVPAMTRRHAVSVVYCLIATLLIMSVILGKLAHGPFDAMRFFSYNYLQGELGELKLIDPDTLEITAALTLPERASFARMALTTSSPPTEGEGVDTLVLLGDEFVHQVQWNSQRRELAGVPSWSRRYRSHGDGTFPGTGPAIFDNVAFFTDNTFPVALSGRSYTMFSRALDDMRDTPLLAAPLTAEDSPPGFMFWSTTVSPFEKDVLVWDIRGRSVQARRATDLSLHWEVKSLNADCLTVAADKQHVYFSDFNVVPGEEINAFIPWMKGVKDVTKYLIVAHTETGRVLVNVTIAREDGIGPSLIVPGAHNDVLIGTSNGISRLYV